MGKSLSPSSQASLTNIKKSTLKLLSLDSAELYILYHVVLKLRRYNQHAETNWKIKAKESKN